MAVARQPLLDGLELEEQIVAEGADQAQAEVFGAAEFVDEQAQNRKDRRLFAALLLRKQRRQRLQPPQEHARFRAERFPMRMRSQQRQQHLAEHLSAWVQRTELDAAVVRDDLERRADGGDIPARITSRIFVSGGQIDAAVPV